MKRVLAMVLVAGSVLLAVAGCRVWIKHDAGWEISPSPTNSTHP